MSRSIAAALLLVIACTAESSPPPPTPRPTKLTAEVGVDDVSFLYPMPEAARRLSLLGADDEGERGALLPLEIMRALPPLHTIQPNEESYHLLRVVSVRVDPCFPGLHVANESDCKNQLRLVMQPVTLQEKGSGLTTMDLALHLFYALDRGELSGLLQTMTELRTRSGVERVDGPVGVHPALAREGVEGPFAVALRALLLAHAGKDNLTRVTFMGVEQVGQVWRFGGFDLEGAKLVPITIPLVAVKEETFRNRDLRGLTFEGSSTSPLSPAAEDIRLLFDPAALSLATNEERQAAHRSALRIENPTVHSPETIDCATCHVAMAARRYAEREHGLPSSGGSDRYAHPRGLPLAGATVERTNELRAFGYFDDRPSISQRAVNETAAVVEHVNRIVRSAP